jgi:hypothetical protein
MDSRQRKYTWIVDSLRNFLIAERILSRKAQYEKKFREWGFKKNHTKEDWKIVGHKVGQRKRAAKESNIYLDRELMPRKKVQKEISRQGYMSFTEQFNQAHRESFMC